MKYKAGDKVRIRSDLEVGKAYGKFKFISGMEQLRGRIVTIDNVNADGTYGTKSAKWFVLTAEMIMPATFAKSDIETGMIVENGNEERRLVVGKALIDDAGDKSDELTDNMYKNDLTDKLFDIRKVYEINPNFTGSLYDALYNDDLILIWERTEDEPPKKMTVAEIEAALGHKVEIVAEEAKQ